MTVKTTKETLIILAVFFLSLIIVTIGDGCTVPEGYKGCRRFNLNTRSGFPHKKYIPGKDMAFAPKGFFDEDINEPTDLEFYQIIDTEFLVNNGLPYSCLSVDIFIELHGKNSSFGLSFIIYNLLSLNTNH